MRLDYQLYELTKQIEALKDKIETLRTAKMYPSLVRDDMPHAHNQTGLEEYAARIDELERKLADLLRKKEAVEWRIRQRTHRKRKSCKYTRV